MATTKWATLSSPESTMLKESATTYFQSVNFVMEVAFRQHTCHIRNIDKVDLLQGSGFQGQPVADSIADKIETTTTYATKVETVNSVNRNLKETNVELTTELARFKNQEKCFEINQEKYDKLETCYQKSVYQEQCLTKKINALYLSYAKTIMTLNEEIANLNNQLLKEKSTVSSLQEEKKKLKFDFKIHEDELLDK
ncbi:hypothetical protein Tco_0525680 [Tanacetum coccineum]